MGRFITTEINGERQNTDRKTYTYGERHTDGGVEKEKREKVNFQKDRRRDGRLDIVEFKKRQTQIKCCRNRETDREKVF